MTYNVAERIYKTDAKVTMLGSQTLKMGSIIAHKIDYNRAGALRGQRHIPSKN